MSENEYDILKVTGSNIRRFRKEKNMSMAELARLVGVAQSSVSSWENGKSFPRSSVFTNLSKYLDKPIDEIIGTSDHSIGKVRIPQREYDELVPHAVDLTALLHSATPLSYEGETISQENRIRIFQLINALLSRDFTWTKQWENYEKSERKRILSDDNSNVTSIKDEPIQRKKVKKEPEPAYEVPVTYYEVTTHSKVAAGEGYGYNDYDEREVYVTEEPPTNYDLATEVEGDSMEPEYHEGDILYLRESPITQFNGQLAVVVVNDATYFKQIYFEEGQLELVSLNPAYAPIYVDFPPEDAHTYIKIFKVVRTVDAENVHSRKE